MPRTFVTDANVWVSRYIKKDVNNQVSRKWLDTMSRSAAHFAAPEFMILEVTSAVARQLDPVVADSISGPLRSIQRMHFYPLDDELFSHSLGIAISLRLKSADCIYVALAELLNVPLVTWDKEILQRAASHIQVYEPA